MSGQAVSFGIRVISAVGCALLLQSPGFAAEEEIVVTGSRIARDELTATSPIAVIDAEAIRATNKVNVEEILRDLPQFVPALGSNTNNGSEGAATLDLRNLGEERTLVLVNGKRFVPFSARGVVDVSMIPTSLIERIEVVTGGESAIYGTDAVAGVVNFILKENFQGAEFDGSYGISEEGDANRSDFSITLGGNLDEGRGNVVLNVGYSKLDALAHADRSWAETSLNNLLGPEGSPVSAEGSVIYNTFPGDPDDGGAEFDANGNIVPFASMFNFNPYNLLQVPQEKWTMTALANYELTPEVEFFARVSAANNQTVAKIAPTGTFFQYFNLNYLTNPFLGPDAVARFTQVDANEVDELGDPAATANDGNVDVFLGRRLVELGTRDYEYENSAYQAVGGLRGDLDGGHAWEIFGQYGRTSRTQNFLNDVALGRAQQAVRAILDPDSGLPVCEDPSGGCQPANFFGPGNLSAEALDYLRLNLNETNTTDQMVVGSSLTGPLPFTFPTASRAIEYAAGIEFRRDKGKARPDDNLSSGNAIGFGASSPVDAEIQIAEAFLEARVPLLDGARFAELLELEAGVRRSAYDNDVLTGAGSFSNDFDDTSWKIGARWSPVREVTVRGMFSRAVRAPNLLEIGLPRTSSAGDLSSDPCEGTNPVGNAELTALCIATGVPAPAIGSVTSILAGQVNNFIGGDPQLEPEEADTWTVGFTLTPESLPLSLSLDYYKIEIDNAITQISEQAVINACYDIEQDPTGFFCSRIERNPLNGSLSGPTTYGVDVTLMNSAFESSEGVDLAVHYSLDLADGGTVDLAIAANYLIERNKQDATGFATYDCTGLVGSTCLRPFFEWHVVPSVRYTKDRLSAELRLQHLDSLAQDAIAFGTAAPEDYAVRKIGSYTYTNIAARYALNDTWSVRASIDNLFDRDPPIVGDFYGGTTETSGNTFPAVYDPLGRYYVVGLNARF